MKLLRVPFILALTLSAAACTPELDRSEIQETLFGSDGVVAGYDFGDSWESIKSNHAEHFELLDNAGLKQLHSKPGDEVARNGYFISFEVDGAGKVESFGVNINGSDKNALVVRDLVDDAIAHYDKTIGKGRCNTTDGNTACHWEEIPGKPEVSLFYNEHSEPVSGSIQIDIRPPGAGIGF